MDRDVAIPADIAATLPDAAGLDLLKASRAVVIASNTRLRRAAWNRASVLPCAANRAYRLGPPPAVIAANGGFPYWWLYLARRAMTCVYEAAFCGHDAREPGTFFIDPAAERHGMVASLWFPASLRLLDLTGDMAFQAGIHDRLSSPDHAWCQWFAHRLHEHGLFDGEAAFDGLLYPSRKDRGQAAIALHSHCVKRLRAGIRKRAIRFATSAEHARLLASPHRRDPPADAA